MFIRVHPWLGFRRAFGFRIFPLALSPPEFLPTLKLAVRSENQPKELPLRWQSNRLPYAHGRPTTANSRP